MGLAETILEHGGGAIVGQFSDKLGLGDDLAKKAISALVPQFLSGVVSKAQGDQEWAGSFLDAVRTGLHQQYLDDPELLAEAETTEDGNKVLGHVLGSKDASREVARKAAEETGIDLGVVKKALPLVAGLAMGAMSKKGAVAGLLGSVDVGDVLGVIKKLT